MNVDGLRDRHAANLARVDSLIEAYVQAKGPGQGRAAVMLEDLLRASVVFSHASLESLARALLSLRLRYAAPDTIEKILSFPVPGGKRADRVAWPFLLSRLGSLVDDLLDEAIQHYLDHFNLNHPADLVTTVRNSGLQQTSTKLLDDGRGAVIEALMKRRHWIVHQLDANPLLGRGHFAAQSLSLTTAQRFRKIVDDVGTMIITDAETELP